MEAGTQTELSAAPADAAVVIAEQAPVAPACQTDSCCKPPGTPGQRPQTAAPRPATSRSRQATPAPAASQRPQTALVPAAQSRPATAAGVVAAAATETGIDRMLLCRPKTAAAAAAVKLTDKTPMVLSFNPDPRLRSWQRLEHQRLHKLGLSSKLSRRYNVTRTLDFQPVGQRLPETPSQGTLLPSLAQSQQQLGFYAELTRRRNEVAPFRTFQKPICGAFFSRDTDNKKIKHNLQPTDLIKWRYFL